MDGNDFNLITPVNSLQNVSSRSGVERRKERKRKERQKRDSVTMKQIADVLKITESRISQLHASALFNLSAKLREWKDGRQ